jgi:DNA (cytosine-5)-methyltransferase 1
MPRADEYLRVKEAAEVLGVVPNTVRSWGDRGKIPEYRHPANNYRLYKRADLQKMLEQIERSRKGTRSTR